ncbi:immunoglobulin I-set domain protein [Gelidibacter sediminis]|uniref:Immunoglobulin I-set domain protein n=1 Tax=Gelidibacter sediminis TaxID=1608710 RepID=A0A4R7PJ00_9FLAO|nr:LamG-like jellyroll fold domain-containing protein [Gelidibacter sediminis]TDU34338.1 immunoglobulin I-set domain protein [Gelidibacter sediminis]
MKNYYSYTLKLVLLLLVTHLSFATTSKYDLKASLDFVENTNNLNFSYKGSFEALNLSKFVASSPKLLKTGRVLGTETRLFSKTQQLNDIIFSRRVPNAVCKDFTLELNGSGQATLTPADIDDGSTGNTDFTLSISQTNFTCADIGVKTITLTVTDSDGQSSCSAQVTIVDNIDPVEPTLDPVTVDCKGTLTAPTTTDACGGTITGTTTDTLNFEEGESTTITWTFDDGNGNSITAPQIYNYNDTTAPIVEIQNITVQLDENGIATIAEDAVNNGSSDICGVVTFDTDITTFDCSNVGENTVVLTVNDSNGQTANANAIVTVQPYTTNATITYTKSPDVTTICEVDTIVFTAKPEGVGSDPVSYDWYVDGVLKGSGVNFSYNEWTAPNDNVKVVMTVGTGTCAPTKEYSSDIAINQVQPVDFNIIVPSNICEGNTVTFAVGNAQNFVSPTYKWTLNGTQLSTNATLETDALSVTGSNIVQLEVTSNPTCGGPIIESKSVDVSSVNPKPTLTVSTGEICANQSTINLNALVTSDTGATVTFHNSQANANTGASPLTNPVVGPATDKTYYVRSKFSTGCFVTSPLTIVVHSLPTITVGAAPTICNGDTVDLSTVFSGSNLTYHSTQAKADAADSDLTKDVSPTATTTYYVRSENSTTGCFNTSSITVTVNPLPSLSVEPGSVCDDGSSIDLESLVTTNGATTYYNSENDALTASSALSTSTVSPTIATSYWVRTELNTGCFTIGEIEITINALPELEVTTGSVCADGQTSVDLNSLVIHTNGDSVTFHASQANADSGSNAINATVSPTTETTYVVRSAFANGCYTTKSITISINPLPTFDVTPAEICNGASIDLNTTVSNNSSGNSLTFHTTQAFANNGTNSINSTVNPTATKTYYIRSTSGVGCYTVKPVEITVSNTVGIALASGNINPSVCAGSPIAPIEFQITNGGSGAGATVTTAPGAGIALSGSYNASTKIYTVTGTTTTAAAVGTYNFTVTPTGCGAASAAVQTGTIRIFNGTPNTPTGLDILSSSFIICPTSTETYEVNPDPNVQSYNWIFPSGFTITNGAGTNKVTVSVASNASAGNVSVTATNSCGTSTATSQPINIGPVSADAGPDQFVCEGYTNVSIQLKGKAGNVTKYGDKKTDEWIWSDNGAGGSFIGTGSGNKDFENAIYNMPNGHSAGEITISLIVYKPSGVCTSGARDDMKIIIRALPTATVASNGPICEGNPGSVTFTGTPNTTITFRVGTGTDQTINLGAGTSGTATVTYTTGALTANTDVVIQSVAYTNNAACTNAFTTKPQTTIVVNSLNTVTPGPALTACQSATPSPITLSGASIGNGAQGQWTIVSGGGSLSNTAFTTNPETVTYTPAANYNGNVELKLTTDKPGECPVVSASRIITIDEAPTVVAGTQAAICQSANPTPITLTGASVGGGNGNTTAAWSITQGGGSLSSIAQTNNPSSVTYTPAANYFGPVSLTLTSNTPGSCSAVTDQRNFVIDQMTTISAGNYGPVCQSNSPTPIVLSNATLAGPAGATAQWSIVSGGGSLSSTAQTATPETITYTPAANYNGEVVLKLKSNAIGACSAAEITTTITVNEAASIDAGPATITICAGDVVNLSGSVGGSATSGTWTSSSNHNGFGNITANATTYTPSAADIASGSVSLTFTSNDPDGTGPCAAASDTIDVTINEAVSLVVTGDTEICSDQFSTLVADLSGGSATSGTWTSSSNHISGFGNSSATSTTYTPSNTDIANGSVTLTFTTNDPDASGPCTAASQDITISISKKPFINTQPSNLGVCATQQASFSVAASGDNLTYQWFKGNPGSGTAVANSAPQVTGANTNTLTFKNAKVSDAGNYYVVVSGDAVCDEALSNVVALSVNQDIEITQQPVGVTDCIGNTVTFTVAATGTIGSYQWKKGGVDFNGGTETSVTSGTTTTYTLELQNISDADNGDYTLQLLSTGGTCSEANTNNATLTVTPKPTATISYAGPFCSNATVQPVQLTGTHAYTGGEYSYSGDTGATLSLNVSTGEIVPSASTPGTYTVTYTIPASGGCPSDNTVTTDVTITPLPVASIAYSATNYCESDSNTYDVILNGSNNSEGTYSITPATGLSMTAAGQISPNGATIGTYKIEYTILSANGCPEVVADVDVVIDEQPDATFSYDSTEYCSNASNPIPTITQTGGVFSASPGGLVVNSSTGEIDLIASTAGTYTVFYTFDAVSGGCAEVQESQSITITTLPTPSISYSATAYCESDTATYTVNLTGSNTADGIYSVEPNTGLNIDLSNGSITPNTSTPGDYTVYYTIAAAEGCEEVVAETTVTIDPKPEATFSYDATAYCKSGANPVLSYSGGGIAGNFTYTSTPSGLSLDLNATTGAINLTNSAPGSYTISNTIAGGTSGCADVVESFTIYIEESITGGIELLGNADDDDADGSNTDDTDSDTNQIVACHQGNGTLYLPSTFNPAHVVEWESSTDNGVTWNSLGNANSLTYTFTGLYGLTAYRVKLDGDTASDACGPVYSAYAFVSVIPFDLKPQPVAVSASEFCLGGTSEFSSTIDFGGDTLNSGGGFESGQLNPNDPDSWLIDGRVKGWTASGDNTKPNQWSGTNEKVFNGTTYKSGDKKFGITFGTAISNQTNDPIYNWDNPYDNSPNNVIATSIETPRFSLLGVQNPTFEFDEAYQLFNGAGAIIEISLNGGQDYVRIPDNLIDGDDRASSVLLSSSTGIQSGNYGNFGNGTNHTIIDLNPYFGNTDIRIRFTMVREVSSIWAIDNFTLPNNNGEGEVQWTDQFGNTIEPITGTTDILVTPTTPGHQTYTVTSYINGCRSVAPAGSVNVQLEVHYANAGYDAIIDDSECGSSMKLHAYDNSKTPLQNYIDLNNAGLWDNSNPLFPIIDDNNDGIWDTATQTDIDLHDPANNIYTYTNLTSANFLPAGNYRDYGTTTTTAQFWSIASGPVGFDVTLANQNLSDYFSDVNDPQSEFFGPGGDYELTWTVTGSNEVTCSAPVFVTLSSCTTLDFDGINDNVTFRNDFNLSTGPFSIEVWVKPDPTTEAGGPNDTNQTILSKRDANNLNSGYDLSLRNNKVYFNWNGGNSFTHSNNISTSRWYHVAVTYDGSTNYAMYIDGILLGSATGAAPINNNFECIMGAMDRSAAGGNVSPINYFSGSMDELRIWKVALSENQIRQMMNQEIKSSTLVANNVEGSTVPLDIPGLTWANLEGYFRMNQATDIVDGYIIANAGTRNGQMRNIETWQLESAPLPYTSKQAGKWDVKNTWTHPDVWNVPNSNGIDGTPIDWNIVRTNHNITSDAKDLILLGLLVDANELSISGPGAQDELNDGTGLWITHYLKIDGKIDLVGESQLVQKRLTTSQMSESYFDPTSTGDLERDQQGTGNPFNYNYWGSPVSSTNATVEMGTNVNTNTYTIGGVLRDGTTVMDNPKTDATISWITERTAIYTSGSPIQLSTRWLYTYTNNPSNTYLDWERISNNTPIDIGLGYIMKGSGVDTKPFTSASQNYVFVGKPNNGTIINPIAGGHDVLLGNPYPSAFDANQFIMDNGASLKDGSLSFWEHNVNNDTHVLRDYIGGNAMYSITGGTAAVTPPPSEDGYGQNTITNGTRIPERYIPVGQGFFVTADTIGGSLIFKNDYRIFRRERVTGSSNDGSLFFRPSNAMVNENRDANQSIIKRIRFDFKTPEGAIRPLLIGFTSDNAATDGVDYGYDALNKDDFPSDLSWMVNDTRYVIQGVGAFDDSKKYPFAMKVGLKGEVEIKLTALENFTEAIDVFIFDSELGTYHKINDTSFVLSLDAGTYDNRFYLVFQEDSTLSIIDEQFKNVVVKFLQNSDEIFIQTPNDMTVKQVYLVNIIGQTVQAWNATNTNMSNEMRIPVKNLPDGSYVIKMQTDAGTYNKKIVLKY